jgi:hypothetical protein
MIRRTFDPVFLNTVINHPEVRPFMGGEGYLDATEVVTNPGNYAPVSEGGGFILICQEPGIYEVHSQFLPEGRAHTRKAMRAGFDYMFTQTDCERVITQVPDNNRGAAALAKAAGFRLMFRREDTPRGPTAFMGLTAEEWAQGNADLEAEGERFHTLLEEAKKARGSELPVHGHDPAHERAVGAALNMIRAGNSAKGVNFYNRWARFAGYAPITLISAQPIVVDVVDAVVGLTDNEMEILLCR